MGLDVRFIIGNLVQAKDFTHKTHTRHTQDCYKDTHKLSQTTVHNKSVRSKRGTREGCSGQVSDNLVQAKDLLSDTARAFLGRCAGV